ncbi:MerR family transcriptional regulator [Microbacterium sp. H1-D42]|uniref:MerR family transcriptional regulator n=1 Tax=Microbacterium sp. H1-D42 TaxID=2925844 RepID=UPI001F53916D|nr:MerR family transcriptional regulator [Microbacterium sp. H1-D42]UNK70988.1 MerR family transcriptional regulator [Microbacterium sp. H1-D42]
MRISELAERSGLTIATLKFYIREGMLQRGEATSATRAEYGDDHLARVQLISALADVRGLPLTKVKQILALIDDPDPDPVVVLGRAIGALPPYVQGDRAEFPRAQAAIESLGLTYDPAFTAVPQLEDAIRALEHANLDAGPDTLRRYADAMCTVAVDEIAPLSEMSLEEAISYSVLGTALYEPLMLALRRLAHQHLLADGLPPRVT